MNFKKYKFNRNAKQGGFFLATSLLAGGSMHASSVIMSPPPVPVTPPVVQEDQVNNEMNVFIPSGVVNNNTAKFFEYGPITLHPHVSYSFLYGNGIQDATNNQQSTIIQQFSPGLTIDLGQHWTLDYTPTFSFYSSDKFRDNVGHSASLIGATRYEDWNFGLSQSFSSSSSPLTETASQTDQQQYSTALTAGYAFNDKWSANAAIDQNFSIVSGLQSSYNWEASEGVSYQFWPRLNVGVNIACGYTKIEGDSSTDTSNPDTVNESLNFNVNWRATDKISFQVSVGLEDEQFLAAGYEDSLNPIMSASVQYQPFEHTQISLSASRTVGSSDYYILAQSSETTSVSLSLSQRILVKYNLNLSVGYNTTDFTTSLGSLHNARTDDGYVFNASFGRSFLSHGTWSVNYQYTDNDSSDTGYSQRGSQIGLQVGLNY